MRAEIRAGDAPEPQGGPSAPATVRGHASAADRLRDSLLRFDRFDTRTEFETHQGIPYMVNQFWTSKQRAAHALHEISYRACFKAQLPEFFVSRLTQPGDRVLDPFMGRGTTPLQAVLMRRKGLGNDVNPLSTLLVRPRMREVTREAVGRALSEIDWSGCGAQDLPPGEESEELLAFYHPRTLAMLYALRRWIAERTRAGGDPPPVCDWIRMVAINRLSGHSKGFFSGRSMPPNQAVSVVAQRRINERLGVRPPERDVPTVIMKKTRSLLRSGTVPPGAEFRLSTGPAWELDGVEDGSVDLAVTSPPFLDTVNYASDNWLRCWFAGIDPSEVAIDLHRSEAAWSDMVRRSLAEQARVLRRGAFSAFEVGEVRNGKVLLERLVWRAAEGLPLKRCFVVVNRQNFTKTSHTWGVTNRRQGTNSNRIVVLQRD